MSASAAKAPSSGAPLSVWERHWLPGGTGCSGELPATLPKLDPQPSGLHSGLSCAVSRQYMDRAHSCLVSSPSYYPLILYRSTFDCAVFSPVCQSLRSWMEFPSCQKTLCSPDFSSQKPPGCVTFCDILPWMGVYWLRCPKPVCSPYQSNGKASAMYSTLQNCTEGFIDLFRGKPTGFLLFTQAVSQLSPKISF